MVNDLMTVHEFALKYRVDVSVVRRWVKEGRIPYTLVGPRKMIQRDHVVRQSNPEDNRRDWNRRQLVGMLTLEGIDIDNAREVVKSMGQEEVDNRVLNIQLRPLREAERAEEQRQRSNPPSEASTGESTDDGSDIDGSTEGSGQDQIAAGPTTPNPSSARRDRRSVSGPRPPKGRGKR